MIPTAQSIDGKGTGKAFMALLKRYAVEIQRELRRCDTLCAQDGIVYHTVPSEREKNGFGRVDRLTVLVAGRSPMFSWRAPRPAEARVSCPQ